MHKLKKFTDVVTRKRMKVRKRTKIRNQYNQAPHLTQDTNGKVTTLQLDISNESQEVSPFPAGDRKVSINRCARKHNTNKTEKMSFKCDRGPIIHVTNLNRNLTQFRPSNIHCKPDPTERNCCLRHVTTKNEFWSFRKATKESGVFIKLTKLEIFITEISIGKSMCCCILVWAHYWSRNGRNNVLIGLPDLAKGKMLSKIVINWRIPNIRYCLFVFVQGRHFTFFTNLINSKFISELVASDNTVDLCFNATQVWQILISITIFFAHALLQNTVQERNITQTPNETNSWSLDETLAGCLENIIKL